MNATLPEARTACGNLIEEARRLLDSDYAVAAVCTTRVALERSVWRIVDRAGLWADVRPYTGAGPALHALRVRGFLSDSVKRETGQLYADLSRVVHGARVTKESALELLERVVVERERLRKIRERME